MLCLAIRVKSQNNEDYHGGFSSVVNSTIHNHILDKKNLPVSIYCFLSEQRYRITSFFSLIIGGFFVVVSLSSSSISSVTPLISIPMIPCQFQTKYRRHGGFPWDICGSKLKAEQMWMQFTAAWDVMHFAEHYQHHAH